MFESDWKKSDGLWRSDQLANTHAHTVSSSLTVCSWIPMFLDDWLAAVAFLLDCILIGLLIGIAFNCPADLRLPHVFFFVWTISPVGFFVFWSRHEQLSKCAQKTALKPVSSPIRRSIIAVVDLRRLSCLGQMYSWALLGGWESGSDGNPFVSHTSSPFFFVRPNWSLFGLILSKVAVRFHAISWDFVWFLFDERRIFSAFAGTHSLIFCFGFSIGVWSRSIMKMDKLLFTFSWNKRVCVLHAVYSHLGTI